MSAQQVAPILFPRRSRATPPSRRKTEIILDRNGSALSLSAWVCDSGSSVVVNFVLQDELPFDEESDPKSNQRQGLQPEVPLPASEPIAKVHHNGEKGPVSSPRHQ